MAEPRRGAAPVSLPPLPAGGTQPRLRWLPSQRAPWAWLALAVAAALARLAGLQGHQGLALAAGGVALLMLGWMALDGWRAQRALRLHPITLSRRVPRALALGVAQTVQLRLGHQGPLNWQAEVFDGIDPGFDAHGLPARLPLAAGKVQTLDYQLMPRHRGAATLGRTQLRLRSPGGWWTLAFELGEPAPLKVFPNFAALARYAWLASDQRLAEIGVRSAARRGLGSDFRQLADYQPGDPVRHIDWKATQRRGKPVVRQYQDERDQRVVFLLDCGRRLRADDRTGAHQAQHFDHVLNALVLTAHVALKAGDEVGLLTFAHAPGQARRLAPRKGQAALDGLLAALHDLEPSTEHPDYQEAARALMRAMPRRALVVLLTHFRDEDGGELAPALRLLRSRHVTVVANLREPMLAELASQPLTGQQAVAEVATAHAFEQARRDALRRLPDPQGLSLDVPPAELAGALVSRYLAVKRKQLL
ncbi:MAG TPA: DUF58 domain-containing protein [Ideonella sp.]|uniref:DUF58 domain-containing protein n=1 Tax=Ideonella sp. TaxID=1929293 RepID=UPI002BD4370A|nr:DUF58 domain-containing protein [Ideonella sp.]HSI49399.1 DUF58 domain-containing protein [Ideonella sp.]